MQNLQRLMMSGFFFAMLPVNAQNSVDRPKVEVNNEAGFKAKPFSLGQVADPRIASIAVPVLRPEIVGITMPISSPSSDARRYVQQGFALIHAQWDFEAYRHFCAALAEDAECLMAYSGVALSMISPYGEYAEYRNAAVMRMLDLIEADDLAVKAGKTARYPKMEKQFCYAVASLVSNGVRVGGVMMKALGEDYPNLLQAKLMGAYFTRGSYDLAGNATPQRQQAISVIKRLLEKHPNNPMVMGFWLSLYAEAPSELVSLEKDVLPYARKLVKIGPEVPAWQHTLGHFEWKSGNYAHAQKAFEKAKLLYERWMIREGIAIEDCESYVRSTCYLVNTLYQRGDFSEAMRLANELRGAVLNAKRPISAGTQILIWRAQTLPARLYIARGAAGDMNRALESLPDTNALEPFLNHPKYPTLAGAYVDALRVYLGCRKALEARDFVAAKSLHTKTYMGLVKNLSRALEGAKRAPGYSHYYRAMGSLAVYDFELYGLRAMYESDAMPVTTANHFRSARDKQTVPSVMMPPLVITHMENRLGSFYLREGQNEDALGAFKDALNRYPNNVESLRGMKKAYEAMGQYQQANDTQKRIDEVGR